MFVLHYLWPSFQGTIVLDDSECKSVEQENEQDEDSVLPILDGDGFSRNAEPVPEHR